MEEFVIRDKEAHFDPFLEYGDSEELFTIKLFHGGRIETNEWGKKYYQGGDVDYVDYCDGDKMSVLEINDLITKLKHKTNGGAILYYFLDPLGDMTTGLMDLQTDANVNNLRTYIDRFKVIEVYCDHLSKKEARKRGLHSPLKVMNTEPRKSGVVIKELDDEIPVQTSEPPRVEERGKAIIRRQLFLEFGPFGEGNSDAIETDEVSNHAFTDEVHNDAFGHPDCGEPSERDNTRGEEGSVAGDGVDGENATESAGVPNASDGVDGENANESAGVPDAGDGVPNERDNVEDVEDDAMFDERDNDSDDSDSPGKEGSVGGDGVDCENANESVGVQDAGDGVPNDRDNVEDGDNDNDDSDSRGEEGSVGGDGVDCENANESAGVPDARDGVPNERDSDSDDSDSSLSHFSGDDDYGDDDDMFDEFVDKNASCSTSSKAADYGVLSDEELDMLNRGISEDELRTPPPSDDDYDDEEVAEDERTDFNAERDMEDPQLKLGLRFSDGKQFKTALKNHCIRNGKQVKFKPNSPKRIRAKCVSPCRWFVYASVEPSSNSKDLVVKSMNMKHNNCRHAWKNKNVTARWVAGRYKERIRVNPKLLAKDIQKTVDDDYRTEFSRRKAYRAREIAIKEIEGSYAEQYGLLYNYSRELKRTHPESTVEIMHTPTGEGKELFLRFYCCLGPLKEGFNAGCRRVVCLDGCHTKGPYPSQILSAISVDPNNGWWPIAYCVVEKESGEQWKWFLKLLIKDLNIVNEGDKWIFMSDRQKGLDSSLAALLPRCNHRYCVQHLYSNFKRLYKGKMLKDLLWAVARSTTMDGYNRAMADLQECDQGAYDWVSNTSHPRHWCKAFFDRDNNCDMLSNNLSESFNSFILQARGLPIVGMLETIRQLIMVHIGERLKAMRRVPGTVCPRIGLILEDLVKRSRLWKPLGNGMDGYQIQGPGGKQFTVDMRTRDCSCNQWSLSGFPCVHGVSAIHHRGLDPYHFVEDCYKTATFMAIYEHVLQPINGQDMWPRGDDDPIITAPIACKQPGRPRKARRRRVEEGKDHGKKVRRRVNMHCSNCGGEGHNKSTCKGPNSAPPSQPKETLEATTRAKKNKAGAPSSSAPSQTNAKGKKKGGGSSSQPPNAAEGSSSQAQKKKKGGGSSSQPPNAAEGSSSQPSNTRDTHQRRFTRRSFDAMQRLNEFGTDGHGARFAWRGGKGTGKGRGRK